MTTHHAFKLAVRARMERTGERYTEARRSLLAATLATTSADPLWAALRGGTVTGIVSGGGLTNLALALPYLIRLGDEGHHLIYAPHGRGGRHDLTSELPSILDLLTVRTLLTPDQVAKSLRGDIGPLEAAVEDLPEVTIVPGPMPDSRLVELLRERMASAGLLPLVWVQDVQTDPILTRGGESGADGIEAQLEGLRRIAAHTGAIIAVGHVCPSDYEEGWEVILNGVDNTFVISQDLSTRDPSGTRPVTIEHHGQDQPAYTLKRVIDSRFATWRQRYFDQAE